jgi:hypothetical protein
MDSGATHSFVRASFLNTLGIRPSTESVNIQLADGQTMQSAGTARIRLHLASHVTDQRKFIVCDTLLDGVDIILGQDFLRARGVILNYGNNMCYLRANHNYVSLSNTPTHYWGNQRRGPPKVVGAVTACRYLRKGAQAFWGLVRTSAGDSKEGTTSVTIGEVTPDVQRIFSAVAMASEQMNPWEEDFLGAEGQLNENSRRVIELLEKPDALKDLLTEYVDRFPTKLPSLPPVRQVSHTIPMDPGHRPPCRLTYRLSHLE